MSTYITFSKSNKNKQMIDLMSFSKNTEFYDAWECPYSEEPVEITDITLLQYFFNTLKNELNEAKSDLSMITKLMEQAKTLDSYDEFKSRYISVEEDVKTLKSFTSYAETLVLMFEQKDSDEKFFYRMD